MSTKANVEAVLPLSPAQRGMLYYCVFHPDEGAYVEQLRTSLRGEFHPELLRRAWELVGARHQALRSLFVWEHRDRPLQVVRRDVTLPWTVHSWADRGQGEREAELRRFLAEDRVEGIALDRAPLSRFHLFDWGDGRWEVVWTFHHLLLDGWSIGVVLGEVWAAYRALVAGETPELPPAPSLREYAGWLGRRDQAADREFWVRTLEGFDRPFSMGLPLGAAEAEPEELQGDVERRVSGADLDRLTRFARSRDLTLNAVIQGAWSLLLARYTGLRRVAFGAVTSGRPPEVPGIEALAGSFANALPAWVEVPARGEPGAWLRELQALQADGREHGYVALEDLQGWLGLPRDERPFDSLVVFENYPQDPNALEDLPGVEMLDQRMSERGAFPVSLYATPMPGELKLVLDHRRTHVGDRAAERLLEHFVTILDGLARESADRLGEVPVVGEEEAARLAGWSCGPPLPGGPRPRPPHEGFVATSRRLGDAVAVVDGDRHVTYRALDRWSAGVAESLRACGAGPDEVVALYCDRSVELVAGMLGIHRAGAAYLPVEPATPGPRADLMLAEAGVRTVVTRQGLAGAAPAGERRLVAVDAVEPADGPEDDAAPTLPEGLAYVIYTSGSSGRPKGVLVEHRNLAAYVAVAAEEQDLEPGSRVLQFASIGFDTSAEEIWPCLARGATLVLRDDRALGGAEELAAALHEWRPDVLDLPTAFWHGLASDLAGGDAVLPPSVRLVIIGGEKALAERLADWTRGAEAGRAGGGASGGAARLLNTYGPTEATIVAVAGPPDGVGEEDPPIGRPIRGVQVAVLDPELRPVPEGIPGELWIGGAGVSRGYLGRPALTAERFVPDPFAGAGRPGGRLYRTGDLVAFQEDGRLRFRGRLDAQLKVRGFRVEPGEIESTLASHPEIREASVGAWGGGGGAPLRLAAWVAPPRGGELPGPDALRRFLAERLPDYMVPSAFVPLDALPRTAAGKIDRRALPAPGADAAPGGAEYAAPRTELEQLLAGWWSELLGVDRVGLHDDFFRLGGHSLLVGRLAARVRKELGVDVPLVESFQNPTLGDLAGWIGRAEGGARDEAALPPITRADRSRPLPLSYQQERVWFLQSLVPGTLAYNFQIRFWLLGDLDVAVLERALTEIVRRHEVLRTTFPELDGEPRQVVHRPWRVRLPVADLRHLGGEELAETAAEEVLRRQMAVPFEVSALPLIRWCLVRVADDEHQLVQVEHHFVHDGWSVAVLLGELKALYAAYAAGEPSPLPELAVQYGDFAVWQRGWMEGEVRDRLLSYWKSKLDGAPTALDLPADRPRPPRLSLRGDAVREFLPSELYRDLRGFGRREGFTLFMTMMAAFQALLYRYTGMEDLLVGTGIANRRVAELEPLIGMMVNTILVRGELPGDPTFRELLEGVRRTTLEAYAHQDMPFERLVEAVQPQRDPSRNPLFQVMFSFHDAAVPDLRFADLRMGFLVEHNRSAKTDLNVIVAPRAEQRVGREASEADARAMVTWEFSTELFDRSRIERLIRHYYRLTSAALADPGRRLSELPLMPPEEEAMVLHEWSGRASDYPRDRDLVELFDRRVEERGDAPAVRFRGEEIGYRELDRRARRIAARLGELGVRRGTPVALALERSADLVPAILGVLRAGGFYVPLDAGYPRERLAFMLEDSGARVVLAHRHQAERLPEGAATVLCLDDPTERARMNGLSAGAPDVPLGPADLAYVIYTSGSTGRPKGVAVPHRAVVRLVLEADFARFGPGETVLQLAPVAFDAATLEIWAPLLTGGLLVVHPPETPTVEELGRTLADEGVTTLWLTAGLFHEVVDGGLEGLAPVRQLLAGGDVLSPDHCRRVLEAHPGLSLVNGYGPTENTTFTACHHVAPAPVPGATVPIGRPVADTRAYVADRRLHPVPAGVPGELVAGGDGLARGYWRCPARTADVFVPDALSGAAGARVYRTGDRVRWSTGGRLEFLGRYDTQVKVRGFRVEPGEVEAALLATPGLAAAVVMTVDLPEERALAAFVVPDDPAAEAPEPARLRRELGERLPPHAVPQLFVTLGALPLTPNGKVDRRALAERASAAPGGSHRQHVPPRTPIEEALVSIWSEYLPVERVSVEDDFFDLGGHSLTATRIVARVRKELGVDLPLGTLFDEPSVARLAVVLEGLGAGADGARCDASGAEVAPESEEELLARAESLSDDDLDALLGRMMADRKA